MLIFHGVPSASLHSVFWRFIDKVTAGKTSKKERKHNSETYNITALLCSILSEADCTIVLEVLMSIKV